MYDINPLVRANQVLKIACRRTRMNEEFVVLNSRTQYVMKYLHDMVCLHGRKIRARAVRHVIRTRGNSCWTELILALCPIYAPWKTVVILNRVGHPIEKTYRLVEAWTYHSCLELTVFLGRAVYSRNSAFKHTAWSTSLSPSRWRRSGAFRLINFVSR